jgi:hypothetical protein
MKLLMLSAAMVALTSQGICQQQNPQSDRPYIEHMESSRLHFMVPDRAEIPGRWCWKHGTLSGF